MMASFGDFRDEMPDTDFKKLNVKNEKFMKLRCHMDAPTRLQFFPLKDFYFDKTVRVYNNNIRKGNYNNKYKGDDVLNE